MFVAKGCDTAVFVCPGGVCGLSDSGEAIGNEVPN